MNNESKNVYDKIKEIENSLQEKIDYHRCEIAFLQAQKEIEILDLLLNDNNIDKSFIMKKIKSINKESKQDLRISSRIISFLLTNENFRLSRIANLISLHLSVNTAILALLDHFLFNHKLTSDDFILYAPYSSIEEYKAERRELTSLQDFLTLEAIKKIADYIDGEKMMSRSRIIHFIDSVGNEKSFTSLLSKKVKMFYDITLPLKSVKKDFLLTEKVSVDEVVYSFENIGFNIQKNFKQSYLNKILKYKMISKDEQNEIRILTN